MGKIKIFDNLHLFHPCALIVLPFLSKMQGFQMTKINLTWSGPVVVHATLVIKRAELLFVAFGKSINNGLFKNYYFYNLRTFELKIRVCVYQKKI